MMVMAHALQSVQMLPPLTIHAKLQYSTTRAIQSRTIAGRKLSKPSSALGCQINDNGFGHGVEMTVDGKILAVTSMHQTCQDENPNHCSIGNAKLFAEIFSCDGNFYAPVLKGDLYEQIKAAAFFGWWEQR